MSFMLTNFLEGVQNSADSASGDTVCAAAGLPITNDAQVILPTRSWDWPNANANSTPYAQFQFADTIPKSIAGGQEYAASSDSFSSNYKTFLEMIPVDKFPSSSMLQTAKENVAKPTLSPDGTAPPAGWCKVKRSGVYRWAPVWELSISSSDWFNKVQSGEISNPNSFTIDLTSRAERDTYLTSANGSALLPMTSPTGLDFESITISADCWGQVSILPGSWFNSAMIKLGKTFLSDQEVFFGDDGLLRGRVSTMFVAYKVSFKLNSKTTISEAVQTQLDQAKDPQIFGQSVAKKSGGSAEKSVTFSSINQGASIVAAIIESYS